MSIRVLTKRIKLKRKRKRLVIAEDDRLMLTFQTTKKASGDYELLTTHTWNLSQQLDIDDFLKKKCKLDFKFGGWIEASSSLACGYSIRTTDEFKDKEHLIYLLVYRGKIQKGGKVKGVLPSRSYSAGTEETWTKKQKGTGPSETNYIYSQIWRQCIKDGTISDFEFYLYSVPQIRVAYPSSAGGTEYTNISPYEAVEASVNKHLKEILGRGLIGEGKLMVQHKS